MGDQGSDAELRAEIRRQVDEDNQAVRANRDSARRYAARNQDTEAGREAGGRARDLDEEMHRRGQQ